MNKDIKQAYLEKMEAQLKEWGAMFEVLKARAAKGTADVKIKYHKQLEDWSKKESDFKDKLKALKDAGEDKFENLKNNVHTTWEDITKFVKSHIDDDKNKK